MNGANTSRQQPWNTELDFHIGCSMVREHTARSQLKFVEMCWVVQDIDNRCTQPVDTWKEHGYSICWMRYKCQLHLLVLRPSAAVLISSPASPYRSWREDAESSNFYNYTTVAIERRCWEFQLLLLLVQLSISLHLFWLHVVFRSTVWCTAILNFFVNLANGPLF